VTAGVACRVTERVEFLARHAPFRRLSQDELERVATSLVERVVPAGEMVLVESGVPGTELYVVREGAFELTHKQAVVTILTSGEVFGHPTLLTGFRSSASKPGRTPRSTSSRGTWRWTS